MRKWIGKSADHREKSSKICWNFTKKKKNKEKSQKFTPPWLAGRNHGLLLHHKSQIIGNFRAVIQTPTKRQPSAVSFVMDIFVSHELHKMDSSSWNCFPTLTRGTFLLFSYVQFNQWKHLCLGSRRKFNLIGCRYLIFFLNILYRCKSLVLKLTIKPCMEVAPQ